MKKITILLLAMFTAASFSFKAKAQNLVPNPSFEEFISCPKATDEMDLAAGWSSYGYSSDYFNACADSTLDGPAVGVPSNAWGYQEPLIGNAYAFLGTFDIQRGDYREFIGTQLIHPLDSGTKYFVSAFIVRAKNYQANGASNNFCFKFSTISYSEFKPAPVDNFSDIKCDSIITDSINWTRISGSFIADSTYQYLMLGNFYDDQHTDTLNINNNGAGYYVDAVCVTTDSLYSVSWTGITESQIPLKQKDIFPNPASEKIFLKNLSDKVSYSLINVIGQITSEGYVNKNSNTIDVSSLADGIYILNLQHTSFYKIIIHH